MSEHPPFNLLPETLGQYLELSQRVTSTFLEIRARRPREFQCNIGCHACCKPGLTVNRLEAARIALFIEENPEVREEAALLRKQNPHKGSRCEFLNREGGCLIYEARPLVCRSHGAPLQVKEGSQKESSFVIRDVCPLNFQEVDLAKLPPEDLLNLDTINTLLALLSARAFPRDTSRTPLTLKGLEAAFVS